MFSIRSTIAAGAVLSAFLLCGSELAAARTTPESFADLAETVLPAVVNISTTQTITAESGDLQ
jgi:serine protease Do